MLDEAPLVVLPSLAAAIGLEAAVVLQQLHFLIRIKLERHREHSKESERDIHAGRIWVWNTYQKWQENHFSFLSVRSLQRIFLNLERRKLIIAGNYNEHNLNKTKWYSINYDHQLIKAITTTGTTAPHKKNEKDNSLAANSDQRETVVDSAKLARSTCHIGTIDDANLAPSYTKNTTKTSTKTTTTTKDELSLSEFSKKENIKFNTNDAFPIPATAKEADEIIKKVLRIVYPNGEGIKNKRTLIHVLKKKLMNGRLEIPEGWQDLQQKKNETVDQESKNNAEKISFQKAKEEFAKLPENEQKKYLDAARRTANSVASVMSDSTALCVAIQLAAKERKEE
ncbi:MAG: hypothetical protein ABSC54_03145 [Smithellaceae bacterium]